MPNELKIGRVYRHFKGDFYLVEAVANDSETGEPFVVYRKLYGDGGLWLRPVRLRARSRLLSRNNTFAIVPARLGAPTASGVHA